MGCYGCYGSGDLGQPFVLNDYVFVWLMQRIKDDLELP